MGFGNQDNGWTGELEEVIELGERVGIFNGDRDDGTPSGDVMTPEQQKAFLESRGMGALYEPGGALYDEWKAYTQGKEDAVNGDGDITVTGADDPLMLAGIVVGGVVILGGAAVAALIALYFASTRT